MSYQEFANDLKNDLFRNGIFLYGSENFQIRWALQQIIDRYTEDGFREHNLIDIAGENAEIDELIGRAMTPSMFPGHRILVIRNLPMLYRRTADSVLKGEGERLLRFLSGKDSDACMVLTLDAEHEAELTAFGKKTVKSASSYQFDRLGRAELRSFINKRFKAAGKYIGGRQMDHLIDLSGYLNRDSTYSLNDLENDLSKIVLAAEGEEITADLIEELLIGEADRFVFNLIDAILSGREQQAMERIIHILSAEDSNAMQLVALLTSQFEMMLDAVEMEENGIPMREMAKRIGVNEFRFRKAFQAARRFSKKSLREILIQLYEIDLEIKTGALDKDLALELFVLRVAGSSRAGA